MLLIMVSFCPFTAGTPRLLMRMMSTKHVSSRIASIRWQGAALKLRPDPYINPDITGPRIAPVCHGVLFQVADWGYEVRGTSWLRNGLVVAPRKDRMMPKRKTTA